MFALLLRSNALPRAERAATASALQSTAILSCCQPFSLSLLGKHAHSKPPPTSQVLRWMSCLAITLPTELHRRLKGPKCFLFISSHFNLLRRPHVAVGRHHELHESKIPTLIFILYASRLRNSATNGEGNHGLRLSLPASYTVIPKSIPAIKIAFLLHLDCEPTR